MEKRSLTGLFLQELLELAPLILNRLLHQMRSDAADGKVSHVHFHQVQDREYRPKRETKEDRDRGRELYVMKFHPLKVHCLEFNLLFTFIRSALSLGTC